MAWAYVLAMLAWALIPGVKRYGKLFVPAILILGVLPDGDLLFRGLGIAHRTVTHSWLLWILLFIPVFYFLRLKAVPYFVAVIQHFAFGDFVMGKVMMFWPFSSARVGLGFGMGSVVDVALETGGLILAFGLMIYFGDLKRLFSVEKRNFYMIFPLMALLVSALYFISHWQSLSTFANYILSDNLLIFMAVTNFILVGFLAISTLQGLRAFGSKTN
jgi:hypothetical protein